MLYEQIRMPVSGKFSNHAFERTESLNEKLRSREIDEVCLIRIIINHVIVGTIIDLRVRDWESIHNPQMHDPQQRSAPAIFHKHEIHLLILNNNFTPKWLVFSWVTFRPADVESGSFEPYCWTIEISF